MKKIFFFILSVFIFSGVLLIGSEKSYAETVYWGSKNSQWVSQISSTSPDKPNFNLTEDTVQLGYSPTHTVYSTKNASFKSSELGAKGREVTLKFQESLMITHAGNYKGQTVNLIVTNINDGRTDSYVQVMPDGNINSYVEATQLPDTRPHFIAPRAQFSLKLIDAATSEVLPRVPVLFTQTQYNDNTKHSKVFGFDSAGFRRLYAIQNSTKANSAIYVNNISSGRVIIEDLGGLDFKYAFNGTTNAQGEINLYAAKTNPSSFTRYNIYNPGSEIQLYPKNYSETTSSVEETTTEAGKYIAISTQQAMIQEDMANFYPASDTFNLDIKESNIDYLDVTENDFTVYSNNVLIPSNQYNLSIIRNSANDAQIRFNFIGSFVKDHPGETIEIKQKSMIKPDEAILTTKLDGQKLAIEIGTELNYKLNPGIQTSPNKKVITNPKPYEFRVEPTLTANVTENYGTSMTNLKDIPIDELVKEEKNVYFPWDIVTASYNSPEQPLALGENTVKISLSSGTFKISKEIEAKVTVEEGYELTYNGNGGKINGKDTEVVKFTKQGIKLLDSSTVVREGYEFLGWSTSPTENVSQFDSGYIYGLKPLEQTNTALYACWKLQLKPTTSWEKNQEQPNLTTKLDRSETTTTLNFYWKANIEDTRFLVSMKQGNKTTELKKIQQKGPGSEYKEDTLEISTKDLSYGENKLVIEFFELDEKGQIIDGNKPNSSLNLTITVLGTLSFKSAPENLLWTQRNVANSIGTMKRDVNNKMDISVVDSREVKSEDWSVQASLKYLDPSVPFDFVWKNNSKDKGKFMGTEAINVMNKKNSMETSPYHYSQTWKEDAGVLLHSDQKIAEGDYSEKVVVNWVLSLTP